MTVWCMCVCRRLASGYNQRMVTPMMGLVGLVVGATMVVVMVSVLVWFCTNTRRRWRACPRLEVEGSLARLRLRLRLRLRRQFSQVLSNHGALFMLGFLLH